MFVYQKNKINDDYSRIISMSGELCVLLINVHVTAETGQQVT